MRRKGREGREGEGDRKTERENENECVSFSKQKTG